MSTFALPCRGLSTTVELASDATALPGDLDALLIPIFATDDSVEIPTSTTKVLKDEHAEALLRSLNAVGAKGSAAEITRVPAPEGVDAAAVIAVGLGSEAELDAEQVRRAAGAAARSLKGLEHVATTVGDFHFQAAIEGLILGAYSYVGMHKEEPKASETPVKKITVLAENAEEDFELAKITAEGVCFTRDLVNTPSSHLYPESYAAILEEEATKVGLDVEILDEQQLKEQGYGGIIAVGQGSQRPPRLVRLTWNPENATKTVAFVGKGITFDTGGISIKPSSGMEDMISDMGGSAAVAGTVIAAARMKLPLKITATLPLAENMPSGTATRPGDVIAHYGGITSEVLNTDAEGRLVLADAIARACEDEPEYLLETATLTGAQIVALGARTSGVMGSDEFRDRFAEISRSIGEPAWAMPLLEEQEQDIKSPIADIRNVSNSRNAGMLYAGLYLSKFVAEGVQWVHVDIAGPSFNKASATGYLPVRATGVPVRAFLATLQELAK